MGLQYQPLRGQVTGPEHRQKVSGSKPHRSRGHSGCSQPLEFRAALGSPTLSQITFCCESESQTTSQIAGEQQLNDSGVSPKHRGDCAGQHAVLHRVGETHWQCPRWRRSSGRSAPAGNPGGALSGYSTAATPSVQELRELMELKRELTQMYQQQQKALIAQTAAEQQ